MKEVISFSFKHPETGIKNEKQISFYNTVMLSIARKLDFRYFFYGGAIRGGKTYVCLYILVVLARMFPKSRWHVFRSDFPELEDTTIPSMEKLIGTEGRDFIWKRKSSNYHVQFSNGSKIFFKSENLAKDPELRWMLGLETNGIFLEQIEGLSEKLYSRAIERVGTWYVPNMPIPIILGTFNPTDTWIKRKVYDPFQEGSLPEKYYYEEALPSDNPYVTADQWENWENLDPISYNQLIKSIWKFENDAKLFAYSFDRKKTIVNVETPEGKAFMTPKKSLPVYTIWDFNVDPITCLVGQRDGSFWGKIFAEYRLRNSNIFELCERVYNDWGDFYLVATGDASGRNRSALVRGNRTFVKTIQQELHLSPKQLQFPLKNPSVRNTRVLMNSIFHRHKNFKISSACLYTIQDLETVKVDEFGEIDKKKDALKTHFLDNVRYFQWNYFRNFVGSFAN